LSRRTNSCAINMCSRAGEEMALEEKVSTY
jgi:hypothetical protein